MLLFQPTQIVQMNEITSFTAIYLEYLFSLFDTGDLIVFRPKIIGHALQTIVKILKQMRRALFLKNMGIAVLI